MPQFENTDSNKNLKFLFLPFVMILFSIAAYKFNTEKLNSEPGKEKSNRGPSSIAEPTAITVPAALKTVLKIKDSDYDKSITAKFKEEIQSGNLPEILKQASPQIVEKIKNGEMKIYSFKFSDSVTESDAIFEIYIDGRLYSQVTLSDKSAPLLLPLETGKSKIIGFKAIKENGKGISFEARLNNSEFVLKNLKLGQSETIYLGY